MNSKSGTALILEGGGMRGLYTTGVLDAFLDHDLHYSYVIGVSAGASHALSYISRQKDRARKVNVSYCNRNDYMGLRCLLSEGSLFGMKLLFYKLPYIYELFDFESFEQYVGNFQVVVTNLLSGKPEYLNPKKAHELLPAATASCSLPFVSPPVFINNIPYLDGGIGDSIPVQKALDDGYKNLVVVLTQPKGYRKGPTKYRSLIRWMYRKYPQFIETLQSRNERYNEVLDLVDTLEAEGTAVVIRPSPQPGLDRLQRNPALLNGLHKSGYEDALNCLEKFNLQ
ncbi:MAG TPA: patatin family protein [Treponemataceae bacterium]|nr:patatin family protein [Treponemataceae bacterium]